MLGIVLNARWARVKRCPVIHECCSHSVRESRMSALAGHRVSLE